MSTHKNEMQTVTLDEATLANYQEIAKRELIALRKQAAGDTPEAELKELFPYGGSFSVAGFGYLRLFSVTPMEFTNGTRFTFSGEGGGIVGGGGVFAGTGLFSINPSTLPGKNVAFTVGALPGTPAPLQIIWYYNGLPIGSFVGLGISAFAGFGGGSGQFARG